ncbi:NUDIX domain-containing protein [Acetobacteraceae bacterium]|nr:NUDIX domain-containing protein [Candidatus Parcubacteria bacterium]
MAHIHEKIDYTVGVYIVHINKVLLRLHEKYNIWLPVGGHIELNEDPSQAAIREVKEEVGLVIKLWNGNQIFMPHGQLYHGDPPRAYNELIPPVGLNRHDISATHEHVDFTYFAIADTFEVIPENHDDQWRWLEKDQLDSIELHPDIHFWASHALDTLGEK